MSTSPGFCTGVGTSASSMTSTSPCLGIMIAFIFSGSDIFKLLKFAELAESVVLVADEGIEDERRRRMSEDLLLAVNPALSVGEKENMGCVLVVPFEAVCV